MRIRDFLLQLLFVTLAASLSLLILKFFPQTSPYLRYGLICMLVFVILSLMVFFTGYMALGGKDKQAFIRISLVFTTAKMIVAVLLNFAYYKTANPSGSYFLLPFFIVYLIYTVFETKFMMTIGKYGVNSGK